MWVVKAYCPPSCFPFPVTYEEIISTDKFQYRFEALLWIGMEGGNYDEDLDFIIEQVKDDSPFLFTPDRRKND